MSRLIGEPLALNSAQQNLGALHVLDAKRLAIAVAEIELRKVAVQVIVGAVLIDTLHAAFEDREESLDGVGMQSVIGPRHILSALVMHDAVPSEFPAYQGVGVVFVGHELSFAGNVLADDWCQSAGLYIVHHDAAGAATLTVYQGQHLVLVGKAATLLHATRLDGLVPADEGLIDFDGATIRAERGEIARAHCLPDSVGHEPCRFESNSKSAVQLVRADPLLARGDQEDTLEPKAKRNVAGLENGADLHGKGLAAVVALVGAYAGALAAHLGIALHSAAMRAYRATRPDTGLYEGVGRFLIVKVGVGKDRFAHGWLLNMEPVCA